MKFIALPPNSTHLTQPLDVDFFRPMKGAWRKILDDYKMRSRRASTTLQKQEFPVLLTNLLTALNSRGAENLVSGFRKTGIYPLNPSEVINRLPNAKDSKYKNISDSFLDFLKNERMAGKGTKKSTKERKLDVMPGRSIGSIGSSEHISPTPMTLQPPLPPPPPFADSSSLVPSSSTSTSLQQLTSSTLPAIASLIRKPKQPLHSDE